MAEESGKRFILTKPEFQGPFRRKETMFRDIFA